MTVLYDDRGLVSGSASAFLNKYQNIGLMTSGGSDSSFQLWWLAKCIDDLGYQESHTLLPIHGFDKTWPFDTIGYTTEIIEKVKEYFPKVNILDPYIIYYENTSTADFPTPKSVYFRPTRNQLESGMVDITITGATCAPVDDDIDLGSITRNRDHSTKSLQTHKGLLVGVDKKFLAYQYKKFDLMESIFPLTKSCVTPDRRGNPCKTCDFCREKYWAFGCYDGGVK